MHPIEATRRCNQNNLRPTSRQSDYGVGKTGLAVTSFSELAELVAKVAGGDNRA
jgi:hypothetical protein